jgi:phosphoribosylformimino-5-aminoimidazole carboxamide ribotide isomerase
MILIPALDIKEGKVVRLFQGKFDRETDYDPYPLMAAKRWQEMGAQWLHIVDLDGAKDGVMANKTHVVFIAEKVKINVQVGGGIRDLKTVTDLINAGVKRVVLGTRAIEDRPFVKNLLALYGEKICVSLDCTDGYVAQRGWTSTTNIKAVDMALELQDMGLKWMIYTDISRDGTLAGPSFEQLENMLNTVKNVNLIASGGIGKLEHVEKLAKIKGLAGAITGRAIYEGTLDFAEALKIVHAQ